MRDALDPHEGARLRSALDRLEQRLHAAPLGLHHAGPPAAPEALQASGLPPGPALFWAHYDGIEIAGGEAHVVRLADLPAATAEAEREGLLTKGDLVIGDRGRERLVVPADPWAHGAEVVSLDEEGELWPEASSVVHLVLGIVAECTVLFDDAGEFRDRLFDEFGELVPEVQRKLLRRRLDQDPDAPRSRFLLARSLREHGELRAARSELVQVLRRAPEWSAAHQEQGLVLRELGESASAFRAFESAARHARDDATAAEAWAWAAVVGTAEQQRKAAAEARRLRPEFASHQAAGAKGLLEHGDREGALRLVTLGLAVAPTNLELLALRRGIPPA